MTVEMQDAFDFKLRVRYQDCDPMGIVHHATYFTYLEIGRTEMLRAAGGNYRAMEDSGEFFAVVKAECSYHRPARYDDLLTIRTRVSEIGAAKLIHSYEIYRDDERLVTGRVTLALLDRNGRPQRIPDWFERIRQTP